MDKVLQNNIPIYLQLMDMIRLDIVSGKLKLGQRIPSVRELALTYKVNPNTMQKALSELEEEGLLYTERTNGKYVTDNKKLVEKIKKKIANEMVDNYLSNMKNIGVDFLDAIKYLQEYGG